jgi:hypothetical protein
MAFTKTGSLLGTVGSTAALNMLPHAANTYNVASGNTSLGGAIGSSTGFAAANGLMSKLLNRMPNSGWKTGLHLAGSALLGGTLGNMGEKAGNKYLPMYRRKGYNYLHSYPTVGEDGNVAYQQGN